jgi:hypothetical protein
VWLWVRRRQGHDGDPSKIMMVGDRFDTDVRAGLSAGLLTCLVTSGCHSIECQQHYLTDPMHHYATGVGALVPASHHPSDGMGAPTPATRSRPSVLEGAQALQAWMLQQSSILKPADAADTLRGTLLPVLTTYFRAIDDDDDGAIHGRDVESALQSLRQVGMEGMLDLMQRTSRVSVSERRDAQPLDLAALAHHPPPDLVLDFDAFVSAMEGALAHCGYDARLEGGGGGLGGGAPPHSSTSPMSARTVVRARPRVVRLSNEGAPAAGDVPADTRAAAPATAGAMARRRSRAQRTSGEALGMPETLTIFGRRRSRAHRASGEGTP